MLSVIANHYKFEKQLSDEEMIMILIPEVWGEESYSNLQVLKSHVIFMLGEWDTSAKVSKGHFLQFILW